jgi:hypothetical protein
VRQQGAGITAVGVGNAVAHSTRRWRPAQRTGAVDLAQGRTCFCRRLRAVSRRRELTVSLKDFISLPSAGELSPNGRAPSREPGGAQYLNRFLRRSAYSTCARAGNELGNKIGEEAGRR